MGSDRCPRRLPELSSAEWRLSNRAFSLGPPFALACHILPPIMGAKHDPPRRHIPSLCRPPLGRPPSFRPRLSPRLAVHPSRGLAQSRPQMSAARTFLGLARAKQPSKRPEREPDKFKMNAPRGDSLSRSLVTRRAGPGFVTTFTKAAIRKLLKVPRFADALATAAIIGCSATRPAWAAHMGRADPHQNSALLPFCQCRKSQHHRR